MMSLTNSSKDQNKSEKHWFDLQFHDADRQHIKKPNELEIDSKSFPSSFKDDDLLDKIEGSMFGMTIGDALGAHVEFRPHTYLEANPVKDLQGGGTWGLEKGQFTDDTSMALCLANSLIACHGFVPYDQLVRYKWWYRYGYMSSTGHCFDIGAATRQSIQEFETRQRKFAQDNDIQFHQMDSLLNTDVLRQFNVNCSKDGVAGNGALMRLAPVPLFFYRDPEKAVEYSGISGRITHGDEKAFDACRYYGALIVASLNNEKKESLTSNTFYDDHKQWFGTKSLHPDIMKISQGSYKKKGGYEEGIRGKGYIVDALEAALWAFWSDDDSFDKGVLNAVNLGDDTDTTAAIYGQLAGAYYGYKKLPTKWRDAIYAKHFVSWVSKWIAYEGENWYKNETQPAEMEPSSHSKLTNSSTPSSSSISMKEKRTSYNNVRSTSIVSLVEYSSILERKAIDPSGRIGFLYDGCHDSIVQSSNINMIEKTNQVNTLTNCVVEKGGNIECQNLLRLLDFDDELRLSLASDIVSPTGIASVVEYPYLIDECTRIFYYSYSNRHQSLVEDTTAIRQNIDRMATKTAATHIITEINWGIDVIVILRLSSDQTDIIDNKLNEICQSLKSNTKLSNKMSLDGIVSTHTYSNIPDLIQQTTLIDVYHEINRIKDNPGFCRPLIYILQPIEYFRSDDKTSDVTFIPLKPKIAQNIEQHLLRLSLVTKMWTTFLDNKTHHTLNTFLADQLNEARKQVTLLTNQYTSEKERLKKLIPNIRRRKDSQWKMIERQLLNEEEWTRLRHSIDDFQYHLTSLKEKGDFIILLGERGFDYYDATKSDVRQGDDDTTLQNKLMGKENKSKRILCSNDTLNEKNRPDLEKLCSRMIDGRESNQNLNLVYADFSYCPYELNDMKIFPLNSNIKRIDRQLSTTSTVIESQDGSSRLFSIDQKTINILLLGKSGVGKSTLINIFENCFRFESFKDVQSSKTIPNVVISFLWPIKHGHEEHFVRLGKYDSNEDHDHPGQSATQNCRSYIFDIGDGKKLRIIDTPGFCDIHGQIQDELTMQHIFACITNLTHLNGICLLIESGDTQLNAYETCLKQLFHFLGDDIAKNIIFCFTKSLSPRINVPDRNAPLQSILSSSFTNNIPFNNQNTFTFDSAYFLQSTVARYYTSYSNQDRTCEESWNISKKGWKNLLNYVRNTLEPYILYQGLQKAEYTRLEINNMIRPILETMRNIFRNILLWKKGFRNALIELRPKSIMHHYAICYSCARVCDQYNTFWIMSDTLHEYWNSCDNCACSANQHMRLDYRLDYEYLDNQPNHQSDQMYQFIKLLFPASVYFAHFLTRVGDRRSDDPFLSHINRMIDEERYICENISSNGMNLELYGKVVKLKQDYQREMNIYHRKDVQNDYDIDNLIEGVKQIPMVKVQLDAARKMKETPV